MVSILSDIFSPDLVSRYLICIQCTYLVELGSMSKPFLQIEKMSLLKNSSKDKESAMMLSGQPFDRGQCGQGTHLI